MCVFVYYNQEMEIDIMMLFIDLVKYYCMILQMGMMLVEFQMGYVCIWVGGVNFECFQYDYVNVNMCWQVGFIFKFFVYVIVINQ